MLISLVCILILFYIFNELSSAQQALWISIIFGFPQAVVALDDLFPIFFPKLRNIWLLFWDTIQLLIVNLLPTRAQIWGVLPELKILHHIERQQFLNNIHNDLYTDEIIPEGRLPLAITGIKGIGKSQEAYLYADRHRKYYQWILWINVSSLSQMKRSCEGIISEWGSKNHDLAMAGDQSSLKAVDMVIRWLQIKHQSPHMKQDGLLILDGYSFRDNTNGELRWLVDDFIKLCQQSYVLITTDTGPGYLPPNIKYHEMICWTEDEGALFLLRSVRKLSKTGKLEQASPKDRATASEISKTLHHFPLALKFAEAYMIAKKCTLEECRDLYIKKRNTMLQERPDNIPDQFQEAIATVNVKRIVSRTL